MAEPIACSGCGGSGSTLAGLSAQRLVCPLCHGSGQEEPAQGSRLGRALTILACLALGSLLLWSCL